MHTGTKLTVLTVLTVLLSCLPGTSQADNCSGLNALTESLNRMRIEHRVPVLHVALIDECTPSRYTPILLGADQTTPLRWGSITKTVTALLVLKLAQQGLIDLYAPVRRYVTEAHWSNPWSHEFPVRVIDLLELRAGLPDLSGLEFDSAQPLSTSQALALNPARRKVLWPPGLQHSYSNLVPGLSQVLVETVTGLTYAEAVAEHLFKPWGWQQAGFVPDPQLPGGFRADGNTEIPYWHMSFVAYGGLNATLHEVADLLQRLMSGRVSGHGYLERPHGRLAAPGFHFDYAAGLYPRIAGGHVWYTHGGDADGYRSRLAYVSGYRRGYVVNINTDNPQLLRRIERRLEAYLTAGLPPAVPAVEEKTAQLEQWAGAYYPASVRFGVGRWQRGELSQATVAVAGNKLIFTQTQKDWRRSPISLTPLGEGQFRRVTDPVATVQFFRWRGTTYMQGELGNFMRIDGCPDFLQDIPQCTN